VKVSGCETSWLAFSRGGISSGASCENMIFFFCENGIVSGTALASGILI
jgi:hypothetical protein